ncbi:hypothetical protein GCM10009584_20220 [Ornithinimicrobium humiphilum]|uniref:cytochrome c oxidase assembly protein n=1 Tax=Ornithinimicrobium humiphilum TaxID=125288 RepID=UPI00114EA086|nr:cytochrome c oxidase assembly protein [Ornithinimicrobium humiphilum]
MEEGARRHRLTGAAVPGAEGEGRYVAVTVHDREHEAGHVPGPHDLPATAVVLSAGGLWVLYATPLYGLTTTSPTAYTFVLVHLLLSGALLAWVLAGPDPAPHRPGTTPRLVALLVSAAAHAVLAKRLYARAGEWPPAAHGSVERGQEAAQLMYYGGDVAELLLAALVLRAWYVRAAPRAVPAAAAC